MKSVHGPIGDIPENTNTVVTHDGVRVNAVDGVLCHIVCIDVADEGIGRIAGQSHLEGVVGLGPDTVMGHHGVGIFWNITEWTMD